MISEIKKLKAVCDDTSKHFLKGMSVAIRLSQDMYRELTKWQFKDKYPDLLVIERNKYFQLMKVR